jgi:succinoglycan biosynthesis transport protein ExoP
LDTTEIDMKAVLAILQRQRRLLIATLAVVTGLTLAYLFTATPIYTSTILMQVDGRNSNLLDPTSAAQEQSAVLNSRVDSEVEILRSEATALAVVQEANLVSDPEFGPSLGWSERIGLVIGLELDGNALRRLIGLAPAGPPTAETLVKDTLGKLQDSVDIRRRGLTYLIAISVSSENPDRAAEIANIYARVYIDRQVATKTQATVAARDVLRRQIDIAQQELAASETAINTFIEDNLARLESETGDPAIATLRTRLADAKSAQAEARSRITSAQSAQALGDWDGVAGTLGNAALAELARQRQDLAARLGTLDAGSDEVFDLQAELAKLETDLAAQSTASIRLLQQDATALGTQEEEARDQLRALLLEADLSAETLADLFNLQQRSTVARDQYQTLLSREQDLGTLANLQIADARIVSEALPPNNPSFPNKSLILALAAIGGLGLGTVLAFLKEYYVGGIVSASQLGNVLQASVPVTVGLLNQMKTDEDPADIVVTAPMSLYAETFRKLRAALDVSLSTHPKTVEGEKRGHIILVCSALQAEGKSTTAISLARTYAAAGVETILIDADLRKPTIGKRLGMEDNPGLIGFINPPSPTKDPELDPARDPLSKVVVLPAGPRSAIPTDQLLNGRSFASVIELATQTFDIIILDSPPLLPVVDTRYLARHADAVVHVVRYATTTQGEVREAAQQLREHLRPSVAYVGLLNLEETTASSYSDYGRYGYHGDDRG